MDNTMDININGGNNPMDSLTFYWKAEFNNGVIFQFENGIEHKFKEVKDKFDKLIRFSLVNKNYSQCFTVDLQNGFIIYNNYSLKTINLAEIEKKNNIRLIFFRRHRVEITENNIQKSHTITYHLGLQYLDSNNINHKVILQINENGDFVINGK
jgi:hypothetical protein